VREGGDVERRRERICNERGDVEIEGRCRQSEDVGKGTRCRESGYVDKGQM
jgi:hypothetical protein